MGTDSQVGQHGGQQGSGHSHGALPMTAAQNHRGRLVAVLAIQVSVMGAEVVGAMMSGSLALLADAGHMLTDSAGVALALFATWLAMRPATPGRTYGWQRAEILAALVNGLLLVGVAVAIAVSAVGRLMNPTPIETGPMLVFAVIGAIANLAGLLILQAGQAESLNIRGAYLEVLGDLFGSAAVITAGVIIYFTGYLRADALASFMIVILILPRAWSLLREVGEVLLEATPRGVNLDEVREHIVAMPGVVEVHDLHAWTITSGVPVLSAHVKVDDLVLESEGVRGVLERLHACLAGHFDVEHCTFQIEPATDAITEGPPHN